MRVGIGYANRADSAKCGRDAAMQALWQGDFRDPGFALAFCGGSVDHDAFWRGLRAVLGPDVPIVGGSAIGVITNTELSYHGYPAGVVVFDSSSDISQIAVAGELDVDEHAAGYALAEKLANQDIGSMLFILYDSLKKGAGEGQPPVMNSSTPLLAGIEEKLGSLPVMGAGLLADYTFQHCIEFCGDSIRTQAVCGVMIPRKYKVYDTIMHGCLPLDGVYHTITNMDGSIIYEIDNEPAIPFIDNIYGHALWRKELPVNLLSIGINHGERFGEPKESEYVNRIITGVLPESGGICLFEADLDIGTDIQFMFRDTSLMVQSTEQHARELIKRVMADGMHPGFALYIDCAGRTADQSNTIQEEASNIQTVMNEYNVPFFGFYSGVEVAPLLGKSRGLDWTGVLVIFANEME